MVWREGRVGPGCEFSALPRGPKSDLASAALIMGDPPKTFGIGFGLWTVRYKLLGLVTDVTDVRYGYCCLALQRFTFWKHDPPPHEFSDGEAKSRCLSCTSVADPTDLH